MILSGSGNPAVAATTTVMMAADAVRKFATRSNVFARIPLYRNHRSLDWWRARVVKPVAEAEEQGQPLV
jgi:hypothetical protein